MSRIRRMLPEDAPRVAAIHLHAWHVAYAHILSPEILNSPVLKDRIRVWREELIPQEDRENLVFEVDGVIQAWAGHGPCRDKDKDPSVTAELYGIYVSPNRFRHGYGRLLWDEVQERMTARPVHEIVLWVLEGNARARRFYESIGFDADPVTRKSTERLGGAIQLRYTKGL